MSMKGSSGDGKDLDAMVKRAGAEKLGKDMFYVSERDGTQTSYKDLDSALSAYVEKVKSLMETKIGYKKPTLVPNVSGDDTPSRTV